jgi:formimidoylglutamate deiminase
VLTRLYPELVWLGDRFRRGIAIDVDSSTGRIGGVEPAEPAPTPRQGLHTVDLPGKAVLPGFVNAHSHAFQRLIRGRTQRPPANGGAEADFWSWREAMYGAALALSADDVYHAARFCFLEMLRTGITSVGEFHYLHHQPDGRTYADPNELAVRVLDAAAEVGIRIVLLNVCYAAGGIGEPLGERQRRFRAASLDEFLDRTAALEGLAVGRPLATVGVAPHSLRAVPRPWLPELAGWAGERGMPLHLHVSEQPAEVDAVVAAYGARPVEVLAEDGLLGPTLTAVHGTHLSDHEVSLLGESGSNVCACPTTERDLGDGFLRGKDLLEAGASICLGTDSHTNLDFLEEMRLIEYHERLLRLRRAVIAEERGDRRLVAPPLLRMATESGARSLGVDGGTIAAGALADLVAVDLNHHSLAGWTDTTLAPTLVLSATPDVVNDVWVGGVRRLRDRSHDGEGSIQTAFHDVARNRAPI